MKMLRFLAMSALLMISVVFKIKSFDPDDPPNPLDAKTFSLNIFNKTNDNFDIQFILNNKNLYKKSINSGKNETITIDGRFNKKRAFFYFLKQNGSNRGLQFFYKKISRARGAKIDTIYLIRTQDDKLVISATEKINPKTSLLIANYSDM